MSFRTSSGMNADVFAWVEGIVAFRAGLARNKNPYTYKSVEWVYWCWGWDFQFNNWKRTQKHLRSLGDYTAWPKKL